MHPPEKERTAGSSITAMFRNRQNERSPVQMFNDNCSWIFRAFRYWAGFLAFRYWAGVRIASQCGPVPIPCKRRPYPENLYTFRKEVLYQTSTLRLVLELKQTIEIHVSGERGELL